MIPAPFDMTLTCKAKAIIRKYSKFGNEKLTFELNSRTVSLDSVSTISALVYNNTKLR
jgi:hypothetical protein